MSKANIKLVLLLLLLLRPRRAILDVSVLGDVNDILREYEPQLRESYSTEEDVTSAIIGVFLGVFRQLDGNEKSTCKDSDFGSPAEAEMCDRLVFTLSAVKY